MRLTFSHRARSASATSPAVALAAFVLNSAALGQTTIRVSVGPGGQLGNGPSHYPSISATGQFVAFESLANNLTTPDTNGRRDIFVFDRATGVNVIASVNALGIQGDGESGNASISADGRFVAFDSTSTNLAPFDTNGVGDVFVRDLQTGLVTRVSVASSGGQGDLPSLDPSISADGRFIAFTSSATNLVPGDMNGWDDVFLHDRQTSQTIKLSQSSTGAYGDYRSNVPAISANGRFVAFGSGAQTLVFGDSNAEGDIFVHDRLLGQTTRVSVSSAGLQSNGASDTCAISDDGRFVPFSTTSTNLAPASSGTAENLLLRDRLTGLTTRISVTMSGVAARGRAPSITPDGHYVAFESSSNDMVVGDINNPFDVFTFNRLNGAIRRVSVTSSGAPSSGGSTAPSISADGVFVAFQSRAGNLAEPFDLSAVKHVYLTDMRFITYADLDGDGYGAGPAIMAPQVAPGYSLTNTDCDDSNPLIHPGASETCNAIDDNCNGSIDEGLPLFVFYADADSDSFGDANSSVLKCSQPPGYVTNNLDCDDTHPLSFPGAAEVCDGRDNDCDGVVDNSYLSSYCTAGTTVHGCVPSIAGVGAPSSIAPTGFDIVVSDVPGQRFGTIFYGFYPIATPWAPGSLSYRCVANPTGRTGDRFSGGVAGQCNGELRIDFNAWMRANPAALGSPFVTGQVFYAQGWFRDPAAPKQTNLSNGLRFTLCD